MLTLQFICFPCYCYVIFVVVFAAVIVIAVVVIVHVNAVAVVVVVVVVDVVICWFLVVFAAFVCSCLCCTYIVFILPAGKASLVQYWKV